MGTQRQILSYLLSRGCEQRVYINDESCWKVSVKHFSYEHDGQLQPFALMRDGAGYKRSREIEKADKKHRNKKPHVKNEGL